ncbi:lytic murein transglycosylase [Ochrobactrum soli]|uniref:Lytic murein transglycosylase n=2 Tax=Ochrobactrum TaxID=528 RepID=A0A2P9HP47_9HYPH|nr:MULTISPECIES: lytic murein transglycosylase [Brucella]RRD24922.1 lytic murein transglycosylase [Brucellaceae bacterium VT-16-1752]WHT42176.1 lytic murein transglycosylase [Ochrobactrum sp. SSR]MDX4075840.1 lytic murein transglycosylase [Brucella sp. NBRC 113783]NNU61245.1 lytic murein transglycosylase [[Ochrobactrum] soli]RLL75826.1 lytic murein transglycosylase [[Ochrobactrum] soli]
MKFVASIMTAALLASTAVSHAQTASASPAPAAPAETAVNMPKPECETDLGQWVENLAKEAREAGVGDKGISELHKASLEQKVLDRDRKQTVFNLTFTEFSKRLISEARLKKGQENLVKYADVFKKVEDTYGVPGPVLAAFWGLETDYGAIQGDFDTLNALVTLSYDCRRPDLFRPQLIALLKLFDTGVVDASTTGAWAGEIGMMQLLPKDYLERGVDGDGDGKVDLKNSVPDAMMTAGRMISELGWKRGQPWLEEVRITKDLPWEEAIRTNRKPHSWWAAQGVTGLKGPLGPDDGDASLLLPLGRKGPAFLSYANFDVFVEWNKSIVYATTAAYFATRLAGAPAFDPGNPIPGLTQDQMKELQTKLQARGYDMGAKIDGVYGLLTRDAVRAEQMRLGMPADSWPTQELLDKL